MVKPLNELRGDLAFEEALWRLDQRHQTGARLSRMQTLQAAIRIQRKRYKLAAKEVKDRG